LAPGSTSASKVSAPVEVVAVTVRPLPAGPGFRPPDAEVFLTPEPLASAKLAREGGWLDPETA
jgi:hypothetical protein